MKKIIIGTLATIFLTISNIVANDFEIKMKDNKIAKEEVEKLFDGKIIEKDKKYYLLKMLKIIKN